MDSPQHHADVGAQMSCVLGSVCDAVDWTRSVAFHGHLPALGLLFLCVASLIFLMVKRLARIGSISRYFKLVTFKTKPCNTK